MTVVVTLQREIGASIDPSSKPSAVPQAVSELEMMAATSGETDKMPMNMECNHIAGGSVSDFYANIRMFYIRVGHRDINFEKIICSIRFLK